MGYGLQGRSRQARLKTRTVIRIRGEVCTFVGACFTETYYLKLVAPWARVFPMTATKIVLPLLMPRWASDPFGESIEPINVLMNGLLCACAAIRITRLTPWPHRLVLMSLVLCFTLFLYVLRTRTLQQFGGSGHAFIHGYWGVPEAWLALLTLGFSLYLLVLDAWRLQQGLRGGSPRTA